MKIATSSEPDGTWLAPTSVGRVGTVTPSPLLLLIDDNRDTLVGAGQLLVTCGFRVDIAHGGDEGVTKARHLSPDVVVSDIVMPTTSGLAVCKQLQMCASTRRIPVVIYTATTAVDVLAALYRLGVRVFAIKPCVPSVVGCEAHAAIATRRMKDRPLRVVTGYGEMLDGLAEQLQRADL